MMNTDYPLKSNEEFMGYCIDMLNELKKMIGFEYNIRLVKDQVYGTKDPETQQWSGMIKELMDQVKAASLNSTSFN